MLRSAPRRFLESLFEEAVRACTPDLVLGRFMPTPPRGRTIVVGAGKASAQMARAFERLCGQEQAWDSPVCGLVVTQYGCAVECSDIEIVEAAHPVPDENGLRAAQRMLKLVEEAGRDDLVVALISGGGSALLPSPVAGLCLEDEQELNRILLASGAPISAMNTIRKVFSRIKGGRLGIRAHPARLLTLIISDVPGDDPAMVASGPTVADASTKSEAVECLERYGIVLPGVFETVLETAAPPPCPEDPRFEGAQVRVVASAAMSLQAAAGVAREAGCEVVVLSDALEGEARDLGREHGRLIRRHVRRRPLAKPLLILSGGETSVTLVQGASGVPPGRGGRNSEYLLALALEIEGIENVLCLAADTDGRDGSQDNAGAFCSGDSVKRMKKEGVEAKMCLENHDAYSAFAAVDDLLICGPTGTNVNDFRALLLW